jgi:hypothetical protein
VNARTVDAYIVVIHAPVWQVYVACTDPVKLASGHVTCNDPVALQQLSINKNLEVPKVLITQLIYLDRNEKKTHPIGLHDI